MKYESDTEFKIKPIMGESDAFRNTNMSTNSIALEQALEFMNSK
mgnify:CR=1 FL=1